jgi:GH35 family endo-1,4-beta-xylanase
MLLYPKLNRLFSAALLSALCLSNANAQLSKNPNKFLGNITTNYRVDAGGGVPEYYKLWNQITPENESKWGSVEGTRGSYNWGSDTPFNYAKSHGFTYKFHALVWGSQYPSWFTSSLPVAERYSAMVKWFDEVKKHYPDLPLIDVVNEAVGTHQQGNPLMKESLGGGGKTGYDWLIKAFELAHERWPNAILIYNDFNTFQHDTDAYIDLVRTLRDAGAPIDAYGCQSHDVNDISKDNLQAAMTKIQNAVKMPMYITELDINVQDDDQQKAQYQNIFPMMWEASYCAGVTIWGYVYGSTWVDHSGLYKNGVERPAMTWLKSYMATDAAKNAKSPFPGGKKQISLYIKPSTISASRGDTLDITVRAQMVDPDKSIDSIKLFVTRVDVKDTILITEAPFVVKYVPKVNGKYALKAIAYSEGKAYTREGAFTAYNPRTSYGSQPISLPGTLQAEHYDNGGDGVTYHDNESTNQGDASFRTSDGVDVVKGNGGMAIGYTNTDEWLEYTVNITKTGYYYYNAVASSGTTGSGFKLSLSTDQGLVDITPTISVPQTASNDWGTYRTLTGKTIIPLQEGKHIIRLTITGSSCNVDKVSFDHIQVDESLDLKITASPSATAIGNPTELSFTTIDPERDGALNNIRVYINDKLVKTLTSRPFVYNYNPDVTGEVTISALAIDTLKHESNLTSTVITVNQARTPYKNVSIPGTFQAEDFDRCMDGITYHDSDSIDEGYPKYRKDNEGVDIIKNSQGYYIGSTVTGEWLEYTLNFTQSGYYYVRPTVCFENDSASIRIGLMDDKNQETVLAEIAYSSGSLNSFRTLAPVYFTENINEGKQRIRITITGGGINLDKFEIRFSVPTAVKYITDDDINANGTRYNLGGVRVNGYQKGISIIDGKKVYITE